LRSRRRCNSRAIISSPHWSPHIGVEIGQIAVPLVLIPAVGVIFRYAVPSGSASSSSALPTPLGTDDRARQ
jgi:hypothetical protein